MAGYEVARVLGAVASPDEAHAIHWPKDGNACGWAHPLMMQTVVEGAAA